MAIFGFRAQDKDFKKAKKAKQQRLQQARAAQARQTATAAAPQRPVTPAAGNQSSRNIRGSGFRKAQVNTPRIVTTPGAQLQEVGPDVDARGRAVPRKTGRQTFTSPPTGSAERQAIQAAAAGRERVKAAQEQLAATRTPAQVEAAARRGVNAEAPQVSTANAAEARADALERQRLKTQLKRQGGAETPEGELTQQRLDELETRSRQRAEEVRPSLAERQARTASEVQQRQAADRRGRVEAAQTRADRAGTFTGDARNAAGDFAEQVRAEAGDTPRNRARLDATKTQVTEGLRNLAQRAQDQALGVKERLTSSEAPGAERPTRAQQARQTVSERVGQFKANRAAKKEAKAARKGRSAAQARGLAKTGGLAAIPGLVGEVGANIQEQGGVGAGLAKTGADLIGGIQDTARTAANTVEQRGLRSGVDLLQGLGEGLLEAGGATGRAVVAGLTAPFDDERTFSDIYRGMEGQTALEQLAARSAADREARLQAPGGGGTIAASPADDPAILQAEQVTQPNQTAVGGGGGGAIATNVPGSDQIGTSGFRRPAGPPGGGYSALGPRGSFATSASPGAPGGGTTSFVQGPGGPGASVEDNVAAYDRQTAAIRDLRNAQREAQGLGAVGAGGTGLRSGGSGIAATGFGERMRIKNMMRDRPEYDPNLTPRQNNARLENWQAGVDAENVARGIDPRSGLITGERGLQGRFGGNLRDQIAMAQFQRQSAKDAFDMQMKAAELGQGISEEQRAEMADIQNQLISENPAERMQGANSLVQAFQNDPNGAGGRLLAQQLGTLIPQEINDERGVFDFVRGFLTGGDNAAPKGSIDPAAVQTLMANAKIDSHPIYGERIDLGGGGRYFYTSENPELAMLFKAWKGQ